jgi:hypothetical protein
MILNNGKRTDKRKSKYMTSLLNKMNDMFGINISPLQGFGLTVSISHGYVALRHVLIHFGASPLLTKVLMSK